MEQINEVEESTVEETVQEEAQEEEVVQEEEGSESVEKEENSPKKSWKELRKKADLADKLQKERDEYYNVLKQIEQEALAYQSKNKKEEEIEDDFDYNSLDDDEILTAKDLKRLRSKEQKRIQRLEDQLKSQQVSAQESRIESELKSKHNDLYDVLSQDNIAKLRELRPSLAKSINLNSNLKEKALDTYQAIKDLGIYQSAEYNEEKKRVQSNSSKPRAMNSLSPQGGNSPLSKANAFANGLTKELKASLYREMLEKSRS